MIPKEYSPNEQRWIEVVNGSGEEIPGFAALKVLSVSAAGIPTVGKPDADGLSNLLFVDAVSIPAGSRGLATQDFPAHALYDPADGTPVIGETWGSENGSWLLHKGRSGYRIFGGPTLGRVLVTDTAAAEGDFEWPECIGITVNETDVRCENYLLKVYVRTIAINVVEGCLTKSVGPWLPDHTAGCCDCCELYWCVGCECVQACEEPEGATAGPFTTPEACAAACYEPYWCVDCGCVQACEEPVGATGGPFATLVECQAACYQPWWCVAGACVQSCTPPVGYTSGPHASEAACESSGCEVTPCCDLEEPELDVEVTNVLDCPTLDPEFNGPATGVLTFGALDDWQGNAGTSPLIFGIHLYCDPETNSYVLDVFAEGGECAGLNPVTLTNPDTVQCDPFLVAFLDRELTFSGTPSCCGPDATVRLDFVISEP